MQSATLSYSGAINCEIIKLKGARPSWVGASKKKKNSLEVFHLWYCGASNWRSLQTKYIQHADPSTSIHRVSVLCLLKMRWADSISCGRSLSSLFDERALDQLLFASTPLHWRRRWMSVKLGLASSPSSSMEMKHIVFAFCSHSIQGNDGTFHKASRGDDRLFPRIIDYDSKIPLDFLSQKAFELVWPTLTHWFLYLSIHH
jgi:hypothetical protein